VTLRVPSQINDLHFGTPSAIHWARADEKEGSIMKNSLARKGAYVGAGAGLVLFAIFGLLPGSLLGGAAGINVAGWLFGLPLQPGLISRAIVLLSMLVGVLVSGIVMVTAASTVGWLVGRVLEGAPQKEEQESMVRK
jgi:small-conductance mechanosensitive channel